MEETIGKRIAAHRRRLGLTQDRLAELLGVTAQAVSKWENDQSCPDISLLPKLSEVFGCSTDELLGLQKEPEKVSEAEILPKASPDMDEEEDESEDGHSISVTIGDFDVDTRVGRKAGILMALWILTTAGLLLMPNTGLWSLLWRTGLFYFGLGGLWPHFSVFHLACALFGGYSIMNYLELLPGIFNRDLSGFLLPAWLLLLGIYVLTKALQKPGKRHHSIRSNVTPKHRCVRNGETFSCACSFGEEHYLIDLPRLSRGTADVSFGALTVDLSGCEEISENCFLELDASFGELELVIPRGIRAVPDSDTAFASVKIVGSPAPDARDTVTVKCSVSFGEITLRYI